MNHFSLVGGALQSYIVNGKPLNYLGIESAKYHWHFWKKRDSKVSHSVIVIVLSIETCSNLLSLNKYLVQLLAKTHLISCKFISSYVLNELLYYACEILTCILRQTFTGEVFYDSQDIFRDTSDVADSDISSANSSDDDESPCGSMRSFSMYPATANGEISLHTPTSLDEPHKRRKLLKSISKRFNVDMLSEEPFSESIDSQLHGEPSDRSTSEVVEASQYKDILLLFRFNHRDFPFKLRDIILSDLRLLRLLEAGLPSWVIFLQSYPVFCHIYRPWMCPLARFLYVIISVVTVLIGFYDLYKNVPVLKATASSLFGPLFDWIETWEMVSRIQYLGTMLFLHNFQKAFRWFLMTMRTTRSFFSVLTQPMAGPLVEFVGFFLPYSTMCAQIMEDFFSVIWFTVWSSYTLVGKTIEILLLPLWYTTSFIWNLGKYMCNC